MAWRRASVSEAIGCGGSRRASTGGKSAIAALHGVLAKLQLAYQQPAAAAAAPQILAWRNQLLALCIAGGNGSYGVVAAKAAGS